MFGWLFGKKRSTTRRIPRDAKPTDGRTAAIDELVEFLAGTLEDVSRVCGLRSPVLAGAERSVSVVGYVAGFVDAATQELPQITEIERVQILEAVLDRLFGRPGAKDALTFFKQLENTNDPALVRMMIRGGTDFQGIDDDPDPLAEWTKICLLVTAVSER